MDLADLRAALARAADSLRHDDVPVAAIVATARRRRRGHRLVGAAVIAVALAFGATAYATTGGPTRHVAPSLHVTVPNSTTPTSAPPRADRWTPYDYGLVRVSLPSGWTARASGCAGPTPKTLWLATAAAVGCLEPSSADGVPWFTIAPDADRGPFTPNRTANGIRVEVVLPKCDCSTTAIVHVPSLGVVLSFNSVDPQPFLDRLSRSTLSRLATDPLGTAPATWPTMTYGSFVMSVPPTWKRLDTGTTDGCGGLAPATISIAGSQCPSREHPLRTGASAIALGAAASAPVEPVIRTWRRDNFVFGLSRVRSDLVELDVHFDDASGPSLDASIELGTDDRDLFAILGSIRRAPGSHSTPATGTTACDPNATQPTLDGGYCGPQPHAGNGHGPDGICDGTETAPPCAAGAVPGRYYAYTLPGTCDGRVLFDGRRWVSMLPPPTPVPDMYVWMAINRDGTFAGFISPRGAVGFSPDTGAPSQPCRNP